MVTNASMASNHSYVSLETLLTGYAMLSLTIVFVPQGLRSKLGGGKDWDFQSILSMFPFCSVRQSALCIYSRRHDCSDPRLFKCNDVMAGEAEAWPTMQRDIVVLYNSLLSTRYFLDVFMVRKAVSTGSVSQADERTSVHLHATLVGHCSVLCACEYQ